MQTSKSIQDIIPKSKERFKSILIFGAPGSGKGTLGRFLSLAGNHCHLSSGDIFRGLSPDSPAGKLCQGFTSRGELVPDDVTLAIWRNYVDGLVATNKYFPSTQFLLLDGLPRTVPQATLLEEHIEVRHILVLEIHNIEGLFKRISNRAIQEKRHDDMDPAIFKRRMSLYEQETTKLLNYYPQELISRFNADQTPLEVLRDVLVRFADMARPAN